MTWSARSITREDAEHIATWRYADEYSLYDASVDDIGELLDPDNAYLAVDDEDGTLVAYGCFGCDARVPGGDYTEEAIDIGVGMRPDLTGHGRGRAFIELMLQEAERRFGEQPLRVTVASFNERSMHLMRKVGFQETAMFRNPAGREFVILVRR
jgi:RimJ/RimL family protein N-acetyltransferase